MECTGPGCICCGQLPAPPEALPEPSIEAQFLYTWESQVKQYPKTGAPGIDLFVGTFTEAMLPEYPDAWGKQVWTLLYRNNKGHAIGILNYYPQDLPEEEAGNVNIWVHPRRQGRGIGTKLADELVRRGWPFTWEQQSYSLAGHAFVRSYLEARSG